MWVVTDKIEQAWVSVIIALYCVVTYIIVTTRAETITDIVTISSMGVMDVLCCCCSDDQDSKDNKEEIAMKPSIKKPNIPQLIIQVK